MGLDNPLHIVFLLILLLLVFGAKRLPEMGRSLGSGMRGFKDSLSDDGDRSSLERHEQPAAPIAFKGETPAAASVPEPQRPAA